MNVQSEVLNCVRSWSKSIAFHALNEFSEGLNQFSYLSKQTDEEKSQKTQS